MAPLQTMNGFKHMSQALIDYVIQETTFISFMESCMRILFHLLQNK